MKITAKEVKEILKKNILNLNMKYSLKFLQLPEHLTIKLDMQMQLLLICLQVGNIKLLVLK